MRAFIILLAFATGAGCNPNTKKQEVISSEPIIADTPLDNSTFQCLLNGKEWKGKITKHNLIIDPVKTMLDITGSNYLPGVFEYINIKIPKFTGIGEYKIGNRSQFAVTASLKVQDKFYASIYQSDIKKSGSIVIHKYDESSKLVSGSFSFYLKTTNGPEIIVTEGLFSDVALQEIATN